MLIILLLVVLTRNCGEPRPYTVGMAEYRIVLVLLLVIVLFYRGIRKIGSSLFYTGISKTRETLPYTLISEFWERTVYNP